MSELKNKVAIVTGSTSGIGESIARMLSCNGVKVVVNSVRSSEKGSQLATELSDCIYVQGDIGIEADCKRIVDEAVNHFSQLDILINNAGKPLGVASDNICDISNETFSQTLNINVVGTWCVTRYAIPYLMQSGDGNIVNITSCSGIDPAATSAAIPYSIAKAAINHLTKFIAKHCGPEIRANAIAPGLIMTPTH